MEGKSFALSGVDGRGAYVYLVFLSSVMIGNSPTYQCNSVLLTLALFSIKCGCHGFDPLVSIASRFARHIMVTIFYITRKQRGLYQGMANM